MTGSARRRSSRRPGPPGDSMSGRPGPRDCPGAEGVGFGVQRVRPSARSLHSLGWKRTATDPPDAGRSAAVKAWGALPGDDARRDRAGDRGGHRGRPGSTSTRCRPGHHRHGDEVHADGHSAPPPARPSPGEPPVIGIVGRGRRRDGARRRADRAGWPIHAVASRDPDRRERFRAPRRRARARSPRPQALVEEVELIILAVPDDAIAAARGRAPACTAARR